MGKGGKSNGKGKDAKKVIQKASKEVAPAKKWCFTWHYEETAPFEPLKQVFEQGLVAGLMAGREKCPETGGLHLQGYLEFQFKKRPFSLNLPKEIHWEKAYADFAANEAYCCKEDLQPLILGTCAKKAKFRYPMPDKKPWQQTVQQILETEPDPRTIHWVWESKGAVGKTMLCKHLCASNPDIIVLGGKAADIKNGIVEYLQNKGYTPPVVLLNIPRTQETVSYNGLEAIKDMFFYSGKYKGGMVNGKHPHLMVFANWPPEKDLLSKDRWCVWQIIEDHLVPE